MTDPRCGTNAGYQAHYTNGTPRCQPCRDAHSRRKAGYRARVYLERGPRRVDATGTRRRIQALGYMGWSYGTIGERLGVRYHAVHEWTQRTTVHRSTAERVAALYDELWDQQGPNPRAATMARVKGWPPPLAYDDDTIDDPKARPSRMVHHRPVFDEIAVQRAMRGDRVRLRPVERAEAVRRLTAQGRSTAEIAERLRIEKRSAIRIRSEGRRTA